MQIEEIDVKKIKPDSNQPRKSFDLEKIKGIAQSIKTEGVINPIEIDKDHVIITGEMRWRASKEAELKTIPCKIIDISKSERFRRQVIENIHHNTMSDWDTAVALQKLLRVFGPSTQRTYKGGSQDKGITWLSISLGRSRYYIQSHLELTNASKKVQEAIQKKKIKLAVVDELRYTPKEHKEELENRIVKGEFNNSGSRTLRRIGKVITQFPEKADKILKEDYSKDTMESATDKIDRIVPEFSETPVRDAFAKGRKPPEELYSLTSKVTSWLEEHQPENVGTFFLYDVIEDLVMTKQMMESWLKDSKSVKRLKDKNVITIKK